MIVTPILPGSPLFNAVRRIFVSVSALVAPQPQGARHIASRGSDVARPVSRCPEIEVPDEDDLQYATWEDAEWQ